MGCLPPVAMRVLSPAGRAVNCGLARDRIRVVPAANLTAAAPRTTPPKRSPLNPWTSSRALSLFGVFGEQLHWKCSHTIGVHCRQSTSRPTNGHRRLRFQSQLLSHGWLMVSSQFLSVSRSIVTRTCPKVSSALDSRSLPGCGVDLALI